MFEATPLFWLVLGFVVGCAACWLVGEWLRWRGTIRFDDDAEQRIRDLADEYIENPRVALHGAIEDALRLNQEKRIRDLDALPDDWKLPK